MDLNENDKFGAEKSGSGDPLNLHASNTSISSDWRFSDVNLSNHSVALVPSDGSISNPPIGSSVLMVDSFCPGLWDHHGSQNLGFCDNSIQNGANATGELGTGKLCPGPSRLGMEKPIDMGWNIPNSMSKGDMYLQTGHAVLPQTLPQFPADSAFIERAARFSCFSSGSFGDLENPFSIPESLSSYSKSGGFQAPEILPGTGLKVASAVQSKENETLLTGVGKGINIVIDKFPAEGSPIESGERETGNFLRPLYEGNCGVGGSSNESDDAEFNRGTQGEPSAVDNASGEPSFMGLGAKKRKRNGQDIEPDQVKGRPQSSVDTANDNVGTKQKADHNSPSVTTKPTGKNGKETAQSSDAQKEDYIHIRARRGQATNSHSLAERVRREKISERMKFLQDLVPGCSKVTGKAVMLDEIINYVQSLQRQVEFLSMKLATVNPRLDFNLEGLLSKDILHSRGNAPSTIGFSPDISMLHPQLHPSQHGFPSIVNPPDTIKRSITSHMAAMNGYKGPISQMPNVWDDELNVVAQMNFGTNAPFNTQELNGQLP